MNSNMFPTNEVSRGDMYYVINNGLNADDWKQGRPAIIVSNDVNNRYSSYIEVVYLTSQDKKPMATHVSVMCRVPSTALCENVFTIPKNRLSNFVRSCSTEEMQRIDQALICSLGLSHHGEVAPKPIGATSEKLLEVELEVYKRLYNDLLSKMMKGTA